VYVQIAQQLYEGVKLDSDEQTGLITYMRTDGVQVRFLFFKICRRTKSLLTVPRCNNCTCYLELLSCNLPSN